MSRTRPRLRALVGGAAALMMGAGALAGLSTSSATAGPAEGTAPTARTKVVLDVTDCEGCTVGLIRSRRNGTVAYDSPIKTVRNGRVTFTTPTRHTHGLLAIVQVPDNDGPGLMVGFRYGGNRVGSNVGVRKVAGETTGFPCWAGTSRSRVTIPVRVHHFVPESDGEQPFYTAWATKSQSTYPTAVEAYGGSMPAFDVLPCSRR